MFTNTDTQDVLFTNCESDFDTAMDLYFNGVRITNESTNECNGDDCEHGSYCDENLRETFFMEDLNDGTYWLKLSAYTWGSGGGDYEVEISCEYDDDWDTILADIDAATPLTVVVSMVVTIAGILY